MGEMGLQRKMKVFGEFLYIHFIRLMLINIPI